MKKAGLFLIVLCFQILIGQAELELVVADTSLSEIIQSKETKGSYRISGAEIKRLPIRGIENILSLDPEYVLQDGRAHLRGSRDDEIGYFLEGMNIRNPMTGQMYDLLIEEATQSLKINAGHFGVNYGNSVAGIVTQQMRSGGDVFSFDLHYRAEPAKAGDDLGGSYASGYANTVLTAGGPLFSDDLRFFVAQEIHYQQDHNPRFYSPFQYFGVTEFRPADPDIDEEPKIGATEDIIWQGKLTPNNSRERYKTNLNLVYENGPWVISGTGAYLWKKEYENFAPATDVFGDRGGYTVDKNLLLGLNVEYEPWKNGRFLANLGYVYFGDERFDETHGNSYSQWYNLDQNPQLKENFENYFRSPYYYSFYSFSFRKPGVPAYSRYEKHRNETYQINLSYQHKFNSRHRLSAGVDLTTHAIRTYSVSGSRFLFGIPADLDPTEFARFGGVNNYGYDEYGNDQDDGFMGPKRPVIAGIYVSDSYHTEQFSLNVGLRFDYLDGDDHQLSDPTDPYMERSNLVPESFKTVDPYTSTNPRLFISYRPSDKTEFYTHYGTYLQLSQGNERYIGNAALSRQLRGGFAFLEFPGLGLGPVISTNYEFGIALKPSPALEADISLFHRHVKDQSGGKRIMTTGTVGSYNSLANRIFGTTRGVVLHLDARPTARFSTRVSYVYSQADALTSEPYDGVASLEQGTDFPSVTNPLDYSAQHRLTALFDYHFGPGAGAALNSFGVNLIYQYNSGHPYTFSSAPTYLHSIEFSAVNPDHDTRSRVPLESVNASSISASSIFDLRVDKEFHIAESMQIKIYLDILNLFNSKNDVNVFSRTGNSADDGFINIFDSKVYESAIARYGPEFDSFYRDINIANGNAYYKRLGKELWSTPRQIRLGFVFSY